jgi:hypothetical protein
MNIDNIGTSLSDLTNEQLLELIRLRRSQRRAIAPKEQSAKRTTQRSASLKVDSAPKSLNVNAMSREEMLALLAQLQSRVTPSGETE